MKPFEDQPPAYDQPPASDQDFVLDELQQEESPFSFRDPAIIERFFCNMLVFLVPLLFFLINQFFIGFLLNENSSWLARFLLLFFGLGFINFISNFFMEFVMERWPRLTGEIIPRLLWERLILERRYVFLCSMSLLNSVFFVLTPGASFILLLMVFIFLEAMALNVLLLLFLILEFFWHLIKIGENRFNTREIPREKRALFQPGCFWIIISLSFPIISAYIIYSCRFGTWENPLTYLGYFISRRNSYMDFIDDIYLALLNN